MKTLIIGSDTCTGEEKQFLDFMQKNYPEIYSSIENTVTNNTLQLLARIYNYSPAQASKFLSDIVGVPVEIGIEIYQQERASESVPDGTIIQRSFKVLVESKVDSGVNKDQILRHAKTFTGETQKILLLLTVQRLDHSVERSIAAKITKEHPGVLFRNVTYESICSAVQGLFQPYENEMRSLVDDYVEYCNDTGLFDQSQYLMRIVPCGDSVDLNKKYGMYFHPSDRGYTKHSYVGVYANKAVQCLWAIDSVFDVEYEGEEITRTLVQGRDTDEYDDRIKAMIAEAKIVCDYNIESGHRFFCGKEAIPTNYVKVSSGGIQGARFVNLNEVVGQFEEDSELAQRLTEKTWE